MLDEGGTSDTRLLERPLISDTVGESEAGTGRHEHIVSRKVLFSEAHKCALTKPQLKMRLNFKAFLIKWPTLYALAVELTLFFLAYTGKQSYISQCWENGGNV